MGTSKGRLTLPSESNFLQETKELLERWGADAIRDSDGTKLDEDIKQLDAKIYTTYFVARGHNDFATEHMEECQQLYLMSTFNLAKDTQVTIDFMDGYFKEQLKPDYIHDAKKYWEVIDRTSGKIVPTDQWSLNQEENTVIVNQAIPYHEYTVSFLVYAIWDPTQMYNHITNNWGDKPHDIPFDLRQPASHNYAKKYLKQWLKDNPDTDVIRFTTFFYHFTLVFNNLGKEKFVDWFGYGASVSVAALDAFQAEYGYALRPEDIVDQGYYNTTFRVPSKAYQDYMDFVQRFVAQEAKELVDIVHEAGREAMMFLGDNWIGTEPYGKYFGQIGLDAVVGSVGGGATLRMISDIPHVKYTEGRFLPYFFPDTFYEGNDPVIEANTNWLTARRAIMRNPVDRIGYGGYLSLAYKFPEFVNYIELVADEYRGIYDIVKGTKPFTALKVAILNSWGAIRTWQTHMVAHALPYKQIYSYLGVLETLSGAAMDVRFISFEDILANGIADDIDVIINAGDAETAFSGGDIWTNPKLVTTIREWVDHGGGFVGIGEPTAHQFQGRYFQLADILGVEKERGFSLSTDKYFTQQVDSHFITDGLDISECIDFGESMKNVYALSEATEIVEYSDGEVHLAANQYGKGRGVYLAGLPYSEVNARLFIRALYYAAGKEESYTIWNSDNIFVEVHAYPEKGKFAIVNNSNTEQTAKIYDGQGEGRDVTLAASEIRWEEII
ncbi:1,3-beta-galactosyl-N-acetylhexosamine phosphorylase [Granulicatella seriolae]|uniref:1,3-beta-galactosyl-N-acetylhexosamine phosphorylase n=1 Tax=Granulicatella seriolae TaxID=2967226 RepID=A0ABT1WQ90_9LACT|nr:1,3-beta-galactosyl-N-acetylhexosamine phosphorylase [Granulicatella seriolae]